MAFLFETPYALERHRIHLYPHVSPKDQDFRVKNMIPDIISRGVLKGIGIGRGKTIVGKIKNRSAARLMFFQGLLEREISIESQRHIPLQPVTEHDAPIAQAVTGVMKC